MQLPQFDEVYEDLLSKKPGPQRLLPSFGSKKRNSHGALKLEEELKWHFCLIDLLFFCQIRKLSTREKLNTHYQ